MLSNIFCEVKDTVWLAGVACLLDDMCQVGAIGIVCPEAPAGTFDQLNVVVYNQRTTAPNACIATLVAAGGCFAKPLEAMVKHYFSA